MVLQKLTFLLILINSLLIAEDSLVFIIRVDDIQSRNTTTLPRSINDFQNAVEARGGKVTWAVIPHRLIETQNYNGILSGDLRRSVARGHEICMHGYNHICTRCGASGHEMFCSATNTHFTLAEQLAILDSGLKVLRDTLGVVPKSFVPPAHVADTTTWAALAARNFPWLSSTGVRKEFIYSGLYNLPPHNEYTWQMTQSVYTPKLNQALFDIKTNGLSDGYFCLLLHDPFMRAGYENGLVITWTAALMDSLNAYFGGRIKYMTLSEAGEYFRDGSATGVNETEEMVNLPVLEQNYPNPFNSSTVIRYTVSGHRNPSAQLRTSRKSETRITIKVYDLLGREVATLADEEKTAGNYQAEFSADRYDLSSGIYICRMQAGDFLTARKMLYIH